MKLHELGIKHEDLIDISTGLKTFDVRKMDKDFQVGDLIHFDDIGCIDEDINKYYEEPYIDKNALYKITYILKDVPEYGLDKDYCILGIKKVEVR